MGIQIDNCNHLNFTNFYEINVKQYHKDNSDNLNWLKWNPSPHLSSVSKFPELGGIKNEEFRG